MEEISNIRGGLKVAFEGYLYTKKSVKKNFIQWECAQRRKFMCKAGHVSSRGCFYHLTQSTWRKIQQLGLTEQYKSHEDFKLFCGMLDGLAFLPINDVAEDMTFLKGQIPEGAEPLVEYFDHTYVTGSLQRVQRPGQGEMIRIRRRPPTFPPELWNVHDLTMRDQDRTNNFCEAWNHGFQSIVGHNHPTVWRLIDCIKEDEAQTRMMLIQEAHGQPPRKRVRRTTKDLQDCLKNLCVARSSGEKTIEES